MEVRLFDRHLRFSAGKIVAGVLLAGVALGLGWFGWQVAAYYRAIRAGGTNPILERQFQATVSQLNANSHVTADDLARLAPKDAPSVGPATASLTVVEFLDFDCPFCQAAHRPVRDAMAKYQDRVRFVARDFPVEELHPRAMAAALAARCAKAQGGYWAYHDRLYDQQDQHEDADFLRYAQQIGLDAKAFQTCYEQRTFLNGVERDLQDGLAVGVQGTPTFFFNGVKVQGALDAEALEFLIQRFLAQSH